jgi:hypothetical protein
LPCCLTRLFRSPPHHLKARSAAILAASLTLFSSSILHAAIDIANFTPATNDRFDNDPTFVAAAHDLSGVGRANSGTAGEGGHWGSLIDKNIFVSAEHYHAPNGEKRFFYPDNDPTSTPVQRTILGGQQVGTSDLWIGHLDFALPPSIITYSWSQTALTSGTFGSSALFDRFAYMSGISPTATGYGASKLTNQAVGTNHIEFYVGGLDPAPPGGTVGDVVGTIENLPGDDTTFGFTVEMFETQANTGDSGSPLLIVDGGNLQVSGTAWLIGQVDIDPGMGQTLRDATFYSYTGNYVTEVQNYIGANPNMTVPEPSSLLFLLAGVSLLLHARRR